MAPAPTWQRRGPGCSTMNSIGPTGFEIVISALKRRALPPLERVQPELRSRVYNGNLRFDTVKFTLARASRPSGRD